MMIIGIRFSKNGSGSLDRFIELPANRSTQLLLMEGAPQVLEPWRLQRKSLLVHEITAVTTSCWTANPVRENMAQPTICTVKSWTRTHSRGAEVICRESVYIVLFHSAYDITHRWIWRDRINSRLFFIAMLRFTAMRRFTACLSSA